MGANHPGADEHSADHRVLVLPIGQLIRQQGPLHKLEEHRHICDNIHSRVDTHTGAIPLQDMRIAGPTIHHSGAILGVQHSGYMGMHVLADVLHRDSSVQEIIPNHHQNQEHE